MTHLDDLVNLLENPQFHQEQLLEKICQTIQALIPKANQISLWTFENNGSEIRSLISYNAITNEFSSGITLRQADYPPYFKAILEDELVVASDARNHSATRCFNDSYFAPLDIHSLLDFILHQDFKPTGIICCESIAKKVTWENDDIENLRMAASLISFCFQLQH